MAAIEAELESAVQDKPKRAPRPRKGFAAHLERVEIVIEPEVPAGCEGLEKVLIGEDVSERLDVMPTKFQTVYLNFKVAEAAYQLTPKWRSLSVRAQRDTSRSCIPSPSCRRTPRSFLSRSSLITPIGSLPMRSETIWRARRLSCARLNSVGGLKSALFRPN